MEQYFVSDERLGIDIPNFDVEWEDISEQAQQTILLKWETIRGKIPDRIYDLENIIRKKQNQLDNEEDFKLSCILNSDIADLASTINDLWLWYRANQQLSTDKAHA